MRHAILVLGMHRSGTSALTGTVGLLGARLPARQMPPQPDNPNGFFESEKIIAIHERLLAAAGTSWFGFDRIPVEWFGSASAASFCDELAIAVQEDYDDAALFVVKDPRMCRLMPIWRQVLARIGAEPRFIITIRSPLEVARSLEKRNSLPVAHSIILWLRHVLEAERETRGDQRTFVRYEELLREPSRTVQRIGVQLGFDDLFAIKNSERDIAAFINPAQRHHIAEISEFEHHNPFYPLLLEVSAAFTELTGSPNDEEAQRRLDNVWANFEKAMTGLDTNDKRFGDISDRLYSGTASAIVAPNSREIKYQADKGPVKAPELSPILGATSGGPIETEYMHIDNAAQSALSPIRDDKKFREASFRLQELQVELASGPSQLDILPVVSEVSVANVSRLNHLLLQRSARVGYLYAMLGGHAAAFREAQDLLEHQNQELKRLHAGRVEHVQKIKDLQQELERGKLNTAAIEVELSSRLAEIDDLRKEIERLQRRKK